MFENYEETAEAKPRLRSKRSNSTPENQGQLQVQEVQRPYTPQPLPPSTQQSLFELAQVGKQASGSLQVVVPVAVTR